MKFGVKQSAGSSAKQLAKQSAKQMAAEPFEIIKQAAEQITGSETSSQPNSAGQEMSNKTSTAQQAIQDRKEHVANRDTRLIEALEHELKEIRQQKEFEKQKQEQEELIQKQQLQAPKEVHQPASKKGRKMFAFSQKQKAQTMQTRVEKPVPPSG